MKGETLTYLVPNDIRREPERPILPEHPMQAPLQMLANETAAKVAPGLPPPVVSFSSVTLGGVELPMIQQPIRLPVFASAAEAERARYPLRMIHIEPLRPTPEEARLYRELTDQIGEEIRRILCGTLTDSVIALPPDCEVEYLEAGEGESAGAWALGAVHDETKRTG